MEDKNQNMSGGTQENPNTGIPNPPTPQPPQPEQTPPPAPPPPAPTPTPSPTPTMPKEQPQKEAAPIKTMEGAKEEKSSIGPTIGIIIVVGIIVIGGLYFWGQQLVERGEDTGIDPAAISNEPDDVLGALGSLGASDNLSDIEQELGATGLDDLDADLANIDTELGF